jgi:hypothetical protein
MADTLKIAHRPQAQTPHTARKLRRGALFPARNAALPHTFHALGQFMPGQMAVNGWRDQKKCSLSSRFAGHAALKPAISECLLIILHINAKIRNGVAAVFIIPDRSSH